MHFPSIPANLKKKQGKKRDVNIQPNIMWVLGVNPWVLGYWLSQIKALLPHFALNMYEQWIQLNEINTNVIQRTPILGFKNPVT